MHKPELLLPAGNLSIAEKAIDYGADAVYVGAQSFSARARAANLTVDEFAELVNYAHKRHAKVYCALNTLIYNEEWESCIKLITMLVHIGVDAFIVQDFGIATMLISLFPETETHASTQMAIMNASGAAACKAIGFDRVVLARETSLEAIRAIHNSVDIDLEVFVQGALCMSYSGLCYMSSSKGNRSGNRGQCAQPCRERYTLINKSGKKLIEGYLLSPKDLCLVDSLADLIDTGVSSLKIEGRMKQEEYVVQTTASYRRLVDHIVAGDFCNDTSEEKRSMAAVFNREGFTSGYLYGYPGIEMLSYHSPKNTGLEIGKLLSIDDSFCKVLVNAELHVGDGIALIDENLAPVWGGYLNHLENEQGHSVKLIRTGEVAVFSHGLVKDGAYKHIISIRRTFDKDLSKDLLRPAKFAPENHGRISFKVRALIGEPFAISAQLQPLEGITIDREWQSDFIVQESHNDSSCAELVNSCLKKITAMGYETASVSLNEPIPAFVPMSVINTGKHFIVNAFASSMEAKDELQAPDFDLNEREEEAFHMLDAIPPQIRFLRKPSLAVQVRTSAQAKAAIESGADSLNLLLLDSHQRDALTVNDIIVLANSIKVTACLPPIVKNEMEEMALSELCRMLYMQGINSFMISNLGQAALLDKVGIESYAADHTLNVMNDLAAFSYNQIGIEHITLSTELDAAHIKKLSVIGNVPVEMIVYGKLPVMHTRYCPMGSLLGGRNKETPCSKPCIKDHYMLARDEMHYSIFTDRYCTTYLLNSDTLNLFAYFDQIEELGMDSVRINGAFLDIGELKWAVETARYALDNHEASGKRYPKTISTTGHYLKGVR